MGMFAFRLTLLFCSLTIYNWVESASFLDNSSDPWQNWLLKEDEEIPSQQSSPLSRRITPKSVFIAPIINNCPQDHRPDLMGRCVKIVRINEHANEAARLSALVQKLNSLYAAQAFKSKEADVTEATSTENPSSTPYVKESSGNEDVPGDNSGPLQLSIPFKSMNSSENMDDDPPPLIVARNDSLLNSSSASFETTTIEINSTNNPNEFVTESTEATTGVLPEATTSTANFEGFTADSIYQPDLEFSTDEIAETTTLSDPGVTPDLLSPTEIPFGQLPKRYNRHGLYKAESSSGRPVVGGAATPVASVIYHYTSEDILKLPVRFEESVVETSTNDRNPMTGVPSRTTVPLVRMSTSSSNSFEANRKHPVDNRLPMNFEANRQYPTGSRLPISIGGFEDSTKYPADSRLPTSSSSSNSFEANRMYPVDSRLPTSSSSSSSSSFEGNRKYPTNSRLPTSVIGDLEVDTKYPVNSRLPTSSTVGFQADGRYSVDNRQPTSSSSTFEGNRKYPTDSLLPTNGNGGLEVDTKYPANSRLPTSSSDGLQADGRYPVDSRLSTSNASNNGAGLETDRKYTHHRESSSGAKGTSKEGDSISNNDSDISDSSVSSSGSISSNNGVSLSGSISSSKNSMYQKLPSSSGKTRPKCDPTSGYSDCFSDRQNALTPDKGSTAYLVNANRASPVTTFIRFPGGGYGSKGATSVVRFPSVPKQPGSDMNDALVAFPEVDVAPRHWESNRYSTGYWSPWDGAGTPKQHFVQIWPGNSAVGSTSYNIGGDVGSYNVRSQSDDYS